MAEIISRYIRGESRAAAISKMECFVIIVNDFQPLTIITKRSILDVAAALDPPLSMQPKLFKITLNPNSYLTSVLHRSPVNRSSSALTNINLTRVMTICLLFEKSLKNGWAGKYLFPPLSL